MKYTKEQRLDIGKRIYDSELSRYEAAEEYELMICAVFLLFAFDVRFQNYKAAARSGKLSSPRAGYFVCIILFSVVEFFNPSSR